MKQNLVNTINEMIKFRAKMGKKLELEIAQDIWGRDNITEYSKSHQNVFVESYLDANFDEKVNYAMKSLKYLLIFNFVQYVGISGSVAARNVAELDDIDLFIVVKNDTAWIWRFCVWFKNLFNNKIGRERFALGTNIHAGKRKNKFCINFIIEERALSKLDQTLFTLHELYHLVSIYNPEYKPVMILENSWLQKFFFAAKPIIENEVYYVFKKSRDSRNVFLELINAFFFYGQIVYQIWHKPDYKRIFNNYRKGIIAYFPKKFMGHESRI